MRATNQDYEGAFQELLPPGAAWPRDPETTFAALARALAPTPRRAHNRAADLEEEADPRSAVELLGDWERVCGLPDPCSFFLAGTLAERRAAVVGRLAGHGGQSRRFYIELAASLGFPVTITEFRPFLAGAGAAGDPACDESWRHAWQVNAPETTIREFTAGSGAGEPLRTWGNFILECRITRAKPAHTLVQFTYGG